jgi:phosphate transport system substrate-binding protein
MKKTRRIDMKKLISKKSVLLLSLLALTLAFTGCGQKEVESNSKLKGEIRIDGSSTVFPITEAIVEEFNMEEPNVKIPVGVSGTGGGFKKFIAKETDISNASRPIKDEEAENAKNAGVEYTEFKVAYDGLSVLVNPENTWVDYLTVEELATIWMPDSKVKTWKDIRSDWPDEKIKFYAPGTDSGTFDYFTEEINGESGAIRSDFTGSEDDNVLVQGIAGDKNALGFFGFAYYEENQDKLKIVPIDNGNGAITPTFDSIKSGEYAPLSRPIFIYVNNESLKREEVKGFVKFYLENAKNIVPEVGYVSLPEDEYKTELELLQ